MTYHQENESVSWRGVGRAATKLIWMALKNITADWSRSAREWTEAMNQFAIAYGDRFAARLG